LKRLGMTTKQVNIVLDAFQWKRSLNNGIWRFR
jgi:hypothetical protein